jgi:hypothetical protein
MLDSSAIRPETPELTHRCAECGSTYPTAELMLFSGFFICGECKPLAVAKIARGETVGCIWRDGKKVVIPRNGPLPDRCVFCNQPANGYRVNRTYRWQHPAILSPLLLLLFFPFIKKAFNYVPVRVILAVAIIVAVVVFSLIFSRWSKTAIPLCPRHRKRRVISIAAALSGAGVAIAIFSSGISKLSPLFVFALILAPASLMALIIANRLIAPTRITRTHVFLNGASKAFLAELPRWPKN